jgi:hypothetical protein
MRLGKKGLQIGCARMAASKRFGKYKEEEKREVREAEVNVDGVNALLGAFFEFHAEFECDETSETSIGLACAKIKGKYSWEDVFEFSRLLEGLQHLEDFPNAAGLFLSALDAKEGLVISTKNLDEGPWGLGSENTGHLFISGDCGDFLGSYMWRGMILVLGDVGDHLGDALQEGRVIVEGNARDNVGECMQGGEVMIDGHARDNLGNRMEGGRINVAKNARDNVGISMSGGEIVIAGNVRDLAGKAMTGGSIRIGGNVRYFLGEDMQGGEIHVEGEINGIEDVQGGKIYHKGKLIVDK